MSAFGNINLRAPKRRATEFRVAITSNAVLVYGYGEAYVTIDEVETPVYTETYTGYDWIKTAALRKLPTEVSRFIALNKDLILAHYA